MRKRNGEVIKNNLSFGYVGIFLLLQHQVWSSIFQTFTTQFKLASELMIFSRLLPFLLLVHLREYLRGAVQISARTHNQCVGQVRKIDTANIKGRLNGDVDRK